MHVLIGVIFALAGALAMLTGLTGRRSVRRLRSRGEPAWAMAVPEAVPAEPGSDSPRRTLIQFALPDGRVMDQVSPGPASEASLRPGEEVLIWYDPEDPLDILVYGREGKVADRVLLGAGLLFLVIGLWLAGFF